MSYWSKLSPTPAQLNAINTYNKGYGVEIHINNKQDAHDVINRFVHKQMLIFNSNGTVDKTSVKYSIIDKDKFAKNSYNKWFKANVKSMQLSEDKKTVVLGVKQKSSIATQQVLNNNMGKMLEEESHSTFEDNLGYLSPEQLQHERDIYGPDPILTDKL